jgi:hypothetical protein
MISADESALICDFAETYGIYDYKSLPPSVAAIFASGLPDTSRIKTKLYGLNFPLDIVLQSLTLDVLRVLLWTKTKDAERGVNRPKAILNLFTGEEKRDSVTAFDSTEELKKALEKFKE